MNPQIDAFISALPDWQQVICNSVRAIIHDVEPNIEETIKRGDRPYFVHKGNVCAFQASKDHVNIFIYDPIAADPHGVINQGQGNATARAVQVYEGAAFDKAGLAALFRNVINNNNAGGWRKVQK